MKKFIMMMTAAAMILSLSACGGEAEKGEPEVTEAPATEIIETEPEETEPEVEILEDVPAEPGLRYDKVIFSHSQTVNKGEWEWFNAVVDPWEGEGDSKYFMQMYSALQTEGSRLYVYLNNFPEEYFADPEAATFDVGFQNTEDGNFDQFAQIRSNDVSFDGGMTRYSVDGAKLLSLIDDLGIKPEFTQLYIQFSGLTEEADAMDCDVTVEVIVPRDEDLMPADVSYATTFTFTKENVVKGDYDWFNAMFSSWDGSGLVVTFSDEIAKPGSRVFISSDMGADRFTDGVPEDVTIGYQGTDDYSIITFVPADDVEMTDEGFKCSVSGERLYQSMLNLNLTPDNSQVYISLQGFNEVGDASSGNITIEVGIPE